MKQFLPRTLWLFLLLLTVAYTSVSSAQTFTVFTEPLAPVHYEENGEVVGIATEIVKKTFEQAGYEPQFQVYPWKRAYHLVQKKKNQFIYTINRTPSREQHFKWIGPILPKRTFLYRLEERDDITISTLEDAKDYMTAVILGHSLTSELEEAGFKEGTNILKVPNKTIQTKVFLSGRSDLITGNEYTIYRALTAAGLTMSNVKPALFISEGYYYLGAHPDTDPEIVERLQGAIEMLIESGFTELIIAKYMTP